MQIHTVGGVDAILLFVVVCVCYIIATFLTLDQVNGFAHGQGFLVGSRVKLPPKNFGSLYVSGKLSTCPFPKATFCPK